ncbi:MAG TPA: M20/M25/M40 family metallo-hydrolase, partial [Pseudoneobacillus sp.]|nr:M20/M25/M40 family metallo-hydrolase [Pseudoneobacillus sp.]
IEKKGEAETVPTITEENHPLIMALQKASYDVNEKELPVIGVMGQSDSRWFIQNGIPAINYGPGTTANKVHGYDECMDLEDLLNTIKVLALFCANVVCNKITINEGVR